jgi:primosomal protein N' (replication factor Y)
VEGGLVRGAGTGDFPRTGTGSTTSVAGPTTGALGTAPTPAPAGSAPNHPLAEFVDRLAAGRPSRVAWACLPGGDLVDGLTAAISASRTSGRQALVVAPSERIVSQLIQALDAHFAVGRLVAGDGAEARLEAYWAAASGMVDVLVGTRAAAFAPLARPGLLVLLNDGDPALREPRAPYPHARTVLTVRAGQERAGLLIAGLARSVEVQALAESGWLDLATPDRASVRRATAVADAPTTEDLGREGATAASRLPEAAFRLIRQASAAGPVLVQVPSANHETFGLVRTAGELVRAFPALRLERSSAEIGIVDQVGEDAGLVVATPGAEPAARGGYAAAVLLDGGAWAGRSELDAGIDALRIWMGAAALVRPGGKALLLGSEGTAAAQALVRWDPVGFAARELHERRELGLPPATKAVVLSGPPEAVDDLVGRLRPMEAVSVRRGPDQTVLLIKLTYARIVIQHLREAIRARATGRPSGRVRVKVDGELG